MTSRLLLFAMIVLSQTLVAPAYARNPDSAEGVRLFGEVVAPTLESQCFACHSSTAKKLRGGLRLDSREAMLQGGDTGPAIAPGNSRQSLLIHAIRHDDGLVMPPAKQPKLSDATIAQIAQWIDLGAPVPGSSNAQSATTDPALDAARGHWSFQPVREPAIPRVSSGSQAHSPVDTFIVAKLQERGWKLSPAASRSDWIRRVSYDLTGLPPAPDEVRAYLNDAGPGADERLVDRLLASTHYGERWGQHWLDIVRFGESEGFEYDRHIPDAWRYRDYVIQSFNADKPYDRFLTEQIAGDEIAPSDPTCLSASIFHRLGPVRRNAGNPEIALSRNEVLTERTDIFGTAFLGLSIGCARCHNHKLEPIPQKDYYRLQAYLAATEENNVSVATASQRKEWDDERKRIRDELGQLQKQMRKASKSEKSQLSQKVAEREEELLVPPNVVPAIHNDFSKRTAIHVLKRGVWENKGDAVGPRPLSILVSSTEPELAADVRDPRTQLARWITSPSHPLTARVMVNRVWQYHFGTGIVKTANDFGTKGDRPSHPELLDWLTSTFVKNGWHLKSLHRLIVLSDAYRQSSQVPADSAIARMDPENRLLSHFSRRRLDAEEIRDTMLAVSGKLEDRFGGPSVMVPIDDELKLMILKPYQWRLAADRRENDRRSIYLIAKRNLRLPFFEAFDAPTLLTSCARREMSTHAPQALEMLNGQLSNELAKAFASRLESESKPDAGSRIDLAFQLAMGRSPTPLESKIAAQFLREQSLAEFALALFNLNGVLYVF